MLAFPCLALSRHVPSFHIYILHPQLTHPQCAPVVFRATRGGSITTLCSNGSDVTGSFASDPRLPTDGLSIEISTVLSLSQPTETTSGFAPGETAPETGGGERASAERAVLVGVLGAGVLAAALLS